MQIGGEWRCVDSSSTIDGWNQNHSPYEWVGSDPTILGHSGWPTHFHRDGKATIITTVCIIFVKVQIISVKEKIIYKLINL
jgi:hypothetical protein